MKCKTLKISKAYRQFTGIDEPGVLDIRLLSCYEIAGCRSLAERSACANHDIYGEVELVELKRKTTSERRMTRSTLHALSTSISEITEEYDAIALELTHESETYMIGVVVSGPDGDEGVYRVTTAGQSYLGSLQSGDRVIQVRKLEPTELSASLYRHTEKEFPAFMGDVRYAQAPTLLSMKMRNRKCGGIHLEEHVGSRRM